MSNESRHSQFVSILSLLAAVLCAIATVLVPEVRAFFGLPSSTQGSQLNPVAQLPSRPTNRLDMPSEHASVSTTSANVVMTGEKSTDKKSDGTRSKGDAANQSPSHSASGDKETLIELRMQELDALDRKLDEVLPEYRKAVQKTR